MPIAIAYALSGPRTAPAVIREESELLGFAVADGTGPPRIITQNLAVELSQLGGQPRVYFDAVLAKAIETMYELPSAENFDDVRVMLHLLEQTPPPELSGDASTGDPRRDTCLRAQRIYQFYTTLQHRLRGTVSGNAYRNIELPTVVPTAVMILNGVQIDAAYLRQVHDDHASQLEQARQQLPAAAGREVQYDYDVDVRTCLFEELHLPVYRWTRNNNPATDDEHLEMLSSSHPAPELILACVRSARIHTQAGGLLQHIRPRSGLVHAELDPCGTVTGRFSCRSPNLQGLPSVMRQAVVVAPGRALLEADLSQTEIRVLAQYSQDQAMLAAFDQGADIHRRTAAAALGKPEDQVTVDEREVGKKLNFQIIYGSGVDGIAKTLQIPPERAHQLLSMYCGYYSGVTNWIRAVHDGASEVGFVETFFGRRRTLAHIHDPSAAARGRRQAVNTIVQGSAAEIMKWTLARLLVALPSEVSLLLTVHDSVLLEVPENRIDEVAALVRSVMTQVPAGFTVPLDVEIKVGQRWGNMSE